MNEIETLIIKSLKELLSLKCITDENDVACGKLVFPIKRDKTKRISEQEARFLLVKQLEKQEQTKFQYSVESPTTKTYCFTGKGERSGNIDLCIYDKGERCNLIEFKAMNPKQSSYTKDFEKLFCDESNLVNYFIQILENTNNGTIPNIERKYRMAIETVREKQTVFQSSLKIFICDLGEKSIMKYEIDKNGLLSNIEIIYKTDKQKNT
jgi:hypothetical protein